MASYELVTWDDTAERQILETSSGLTADFSSLRIGASNLPITESGGSYSFGDNPIVDVTSLAVGLSAVIIGEASGDLSVFSVQIKDLPATPTISTELANKDYADALQSNIGFHASCTVIATASLAVNAAGSGIGKTLTAQSAGLLSIDGVSTWVDMDNDSGVNNPFPPDGFTAASRVLVNNQANQADNGVYAVKDKGGAGTFELVRAIDFDETIKETAFTFIEQGTSNEHSGWVFGVTADIVIDTDPVVFVQWTGEETLAAGDGVDITGTTISVDLATNSGLEFSSGELQVDLVAAGAGVGGLVLTGNEIEINTGNGTELTSNGLQVDPYTGANAPSKANALDVTANGLRLRVDASSIEGSLQGGAGAEDLRVKDAGITSSHLNTSVAGDGLGGGAGSALEVNTGDGLEIDSDNVVRDFTEPMENGNASAITKREIVYVDTDGTVKLANAAYPIDNQLVMVMDATSVNSGIQGSTTMREGAIITGFTGLTPGKRQYVSETDGELTESISGFSSSGLRRIYTVGRAKSATELIYFPRFEFIMGEVPLAQNLLSDASFGALTAWTLINSSPGAAAPSQQTYNPVTRNLTSSEKPAGGDNYWLAGGSGSTATTTAKASQEVSVLSYGGHTATLSAYLGGNNAGDDLAVVYGKIEDTDNNALNQVEGRYVHISGSMPVSNGEDGDYVYIPDLEGSFSITPDYSALTITGATDTDFNGTYSRNTTIYGSLQGTSTDFELTTIIDSAIYTKNGTSGTTAFMFHWQNSQWTCVKNCDIDMSIGQGHGAIVREDANTTNSGDVEQIYPSGSYPNVNYDGANYPNDSAPDFSWDNTPVSTFVTTNAYRVYEQIGSTNRFLIWKTSEYGGFMLVTVQGGAWTKGDLVNNFDMGVVDTDYYQTQMVSWNQWTSDFKGIPPVDGGYIKTRWDYPGFCRSSWQRTGVEMIQKSVAMTLPGNADALTVTCEFVNDDSSGDIDSGVDEISLTLS